MDEIPHFAWPLRFEGSGWAVVQQDTNAEAAANVAVICCFPRGWRDEDPEFGIDDPTFSLQPVNTQSIEDQIALREPRVVVYVDTPEVPADPGASPVKVRVSLANEEE